MIDFAEIQKYDLVDKTGAYSFDGEERAEKCMKIPVSGIDVKWDEDK